MDKVTPEKRSSMMRAIRGKDTSPEIFVRHLFRELGYKGYRLHKKELPGKPDLAFLGLKKAVFVHGCFWHGHDCPIGRRIPKSNQSYWITKISKNRIRDAEHAKKYSEMGWAVLVLWGCELKKEHVPDKIAAFMRMA